ncbi:unnamed protein product [Lepeophtheirus salmonis]|uniref:(salmon louse) hypothetical protein n=1 Tax=Lepeophtheirus salmonis TaxID=72036 RepID=A0A7R8CRH4_LEPSM|nr:unnamed protein product [Lepeophtheirus salmonis]CAF2905360.1 unnamed protein product [Lepeophtheirus salmonis]
MSRHLLLGVIFVKRLPPCNPKYEKPEGLTFHRFPHDPNKLDETKLVDGLNTMIQTDTNRLNGLRYTLLQKDEQDVSNLIECGNRFVTETVERHAMVELELLAATTSLSSQSSAKKQHLRAVESTRIPRFQIYLTPYDIKIVWKSGKDNCLADALSCSPVDKPTKVENDFTQDMFGSSHTIKVNHLDTLNNSDISQIECDPIILEGIARGPILEVVAQASRNVPVFCLLKDNILEKIDKQNINPVQKPDTKILPHFTIDNDLILFIIKGQKRHRTGPAKLFFCQESQQIYETSSKLQKNAKVVDQAYPRNISNRT